MVIIILILIFDTHRLREMVLRWLPVSSNAALEGQDPAQGESPIKTVLRSKGFMWMSHSHTTAFYWSHAGQHFEIRDEGDWYMSPQTLCSDMTVWEVICTCFDLTAWLSAYFLAVICG